MKISAAIKDAFRVYTGHFGATLKFLAVEGCMTLAAFVPLLFLTEGSLKYLALLAVPFYLLLMLWARVNAAAAMRDTFDGGSLFSYRLIEPGDYRKKLAYGLKRAVMLLIWGAPLIAFLVLAKIYISGDTDGFTLMRAIKSFGGENLTTGLLYVALIFLATLVLLAIGCAFHSGDRHAFVREDPKLVRGHHGGHPGGGLLPAGAEGYQCDREKTGHPAVFKARDHLSCGRRGADSTAAAVPRADSCSLCERAEKGVRPDR